METAKCATCGSEVEFDVAKCPDCGAEQIGKIVLRRPLKGKEAPQSVWFVDLNGEYIGDIRQGDIITEDVLPGGHDVCVTFKGVIGSIKGEITVDVADGQQVELVAYYKQGALVSKLLLEETNRTPLLRRPVKGKTQPSKTKSTEVSPSKVLQPMTNIETMPPKVQNTGVSSSEVLGYCRKCGRALPDDAEFCPKCGTQRLGGVAVVANNTQYEEMEIEARGGDLVVGRSFVTSMMGMGSILKYQFVGRITGPAGTRIMPLMEFALTNNDQPKDANNRPELRKMFDGCLVELESQGWEPVKPSGREWYSYRYRRPVE